MNNQIRLEKLHQAVVLSELRAFILNLKVAKHVLDTASDAVMHSEEYILATRNGFKVAESFYYHCDPEEHIRGNQEANHQKIIQYLSINSGNKR